jgi:hypothetical protein
MKPNIAIKIPLIILVSLLGLSYFVLLGGSIYEAIVFPASPQKVTLSQAMTIDSQNEPVFLFFRKALYVSITDAIWDCASVQQVDAPAYRVDHTEGAFSNANMDAIVLVQINGLYTCNELRHMQLAGKLERLTEGPVYSKTAMNELAIIGKNPDAITFELCTHCTPAEARIFPLLFFLIPFAMGGIYAYGKCQQMSQDSD